MWMFAISIVFMGVLLWLALRRRAGSAAVLSALGAIFFLGIMDALAFLLLLALTLLLILLKITRPPERVALGAVLAWAICSMAFVVGVAVQVRRERLQKFPIVPLGNRLSYESPPALANSQTERGNELQQHVLSDIAERHLAEYDRPSNAVRSHFLQKLHEQTLVAFVLANRFGSARMGDLQRAWLEYHEGLPLEPFPPSPKEVDPPTAAPNPVVAEIDLPVADFPRSDLMTLYDRALKDFLSPDRIGYVPSYQRAAGFLGHAVTRPQLEESKDWQVSHLDLVSLLKFAGPRVYLSEHLPRMEELRDAKTRPVDEFEQQALQQLRDGEEIVIEQQLNTIRMVGAVRAAKQCLDCHSVRRGQLLGAFSYLLDRKQPIREPQADGQPVSLLAR